MDQFSELDVVVDLPQNLDKAEVAEFRFEAIDVSNKGRVTVNARDVHIVAGDKGRELLATLRVPDYDGKTRRAVSIDLRKSLERAVARGELAPRADFADAEENAAIDMIIEQLAYCRPGLYQIYAVYQHDNTELRSNWIKLRVNESKQVLTLPPLPFYTWWPAIAVGSLIIPPLAAYIAWKRRPLPLGRRIALLVIQILMTVLLVASLGYMVLVHNRPNVPERETTSRTAHRTGPAGALRPAALIVQPLEAIRLSGFF
jgi:hypothetical protein